LWLLVGTVLIAAVGPLAGWWHYEVVESGSMTPTLRTGGIAVIEAEPVSAVRVGQVIAFHPPGMGNYLRIHRVISLTQRHGQVWVTTKGDANNVADPGPIRLEGKTAYTERLFVPYVGYAGVWLYKHSTRVALEWALVALVVCGGLYLIWDQPEQEADELAPDARTARGAMATTGTASGATATTASGATATTATGTASGATATTATATAAALATQAATSSLMALSRARSASGDDETAEPAAVGGTRHTASSG
jgi:signal peptidase